MASILKTIFGGSNSTMTLDSFNKQVIDDYFRTYLFTVNIFTTNVETSSVTYNDMGSVIAGQLQYMANIDVTVSDDSKKSEFKCEWVATTQTPVSTTGVQIVDWMHSQIKQSGRTTTQQWTVSVRDDAKSNAFKFFNAWKNSVYAFDQTSSSTTPARYKKGATVSLLKPTENFDSASRLYNLYGVWPMEIGSISLDYDSEGIATFPVTLSIDYFTVVTQ